MARLARLGCDDRSEIGHRPPYLETGSARLARQREVERQLGTRLAADELTWPSRHEPPVQIAVLLIAPVAPPSVVDYARACFRARRLPARAELGQARQIVAGRR